MYQLPIIFCKELLCLVAELCRDVLVDYAATKRNSVVCNLYVMKGCDLYLFSRFTDCIRQTIKTNQVIYYKNKSSYICIYCVVSGYILAK